MSGYNAETGAFACVFSSYRVIRRRLPEGAASDSIMPMAAKTWKGEWWKQGGGGTTWDTIVYDPKLQLVYFGTGNGSPHPSAFRSPRRGDNLFLCSVVAVDVKTGHYAWHYQEIPQEEWDYDCTSPLMIADTEDRRPHTPGHHARAQGWLLLRAGSKTGKLISAKPYVMNTWAIKHRYEDRGARSWSPTPPLRKSRTC